MGAVAGEADVAAGSPDRCADQVGWAVDYYSGEVAAGSARKGGSFHAAENIFCVAGVEGCGANADNDFTWAWLRVGEGFDVQIFETAEVMESQGLHDVRLSRLWKSTALQKFL